MPLGEYLKSNNNRILKTTLKAYTDYVQTITRKQKPFYVDFVKDFFDNISRALVIPSESIIHAYEDNVSRRPQLPNVPVTQIATGQNSDVSSEHIYQEFHEVKVPKIKLNELVIRPEPFDGVKPNPRKWLDNYERAARANGWSDIIMVTYFPTFVIKSALDWHVAMAQRKLKRDSSWNDLKQMFIRHYLGEADRAATKRELEKCYQRESELATCFIPRFMRLMLLLDPNKDEEDIVDLVKDRLRSVYQADLAKSTIKSLDELNDLCLKIESGIAAAKCAAARETRDTKQTNVKNFKNRINSRKSSMPSTEEKSLDTSSVKKKLDITCYKCERIGHAANKCNFKSKPDGGKLNDKTSYAEIAKRYGPKTSSKNKALVVDDQENMSEQTSENVSIVKQIRSPGYICTIMSVNCKQPTGKSLTCTLIVNKVSIPSLVDTGATLSAISLKLVKENDWHLLPADTKLIAADSKNLQARAADAPSAFINGRNKLSYAVLETNAAANDPNPYKVAATGPFIAIRTIGTIIALQATGWNITSTQTVLLPANNS